MSDSPRKLDIIDPHYVPVSPIDDVIVDTLPNGNILVTTLEVQPDVDGELVAMVMHRVEWTPTALRKAIDKVNTGMDPGNIANLVPANNLAS